MSKKEPVPRPVDVSGPKGRTLERIEDLEKTRVYKQEDLEKKPEDTFRQDSLAETERQLAVLESKHMASLDSDDGE